MRPGIPVLLSSGYATEELLPDAQAAGVREVLRKETAYRDLMPAIARTLGAAPRG